MAEYRAALSWYAARSLDAAEGFADVIDEGIRAIQAVSEASPTWPGRKDVRVRVLRRYPYVVVYVVRPRQIVVVAIAHQRRRPGYWLARLQP